MTTRRRCPGRHGAAIYPPVRAALAELLALAEMDRAELRPIIDGLLDQEDQR